MLSGFFSTVQYVRCIWVCVCVSAYCIHIYVYIYTVRVKTELNWDPRPVAIWGIVFSEGPQPINLIYVKIRECARVTPQLLFLKVRELKEPGICLFFTLKCPCLSLYPSTHFLSLIRLFLPSLYPNDIAPSYIVCVRVHGSIRSICPRPVFIRRQAVQAHMQLSQEMPPHGSHGWKASSPSLVLAKEET